jgi:thiol-disulfide isomerase/thioredoxin
MIEIENKSDFDFQINKKSRVLALFYTSWCPFCRRFMQIFKEDTNQNSFDTVLCVKLDDYSNPLWEDYSIDNVPAVIYFDKGRVAQRIDATSGIGLTKSQFSSLLVKCSNKLIS